jgi:hypothetical protein
MVVKNTRALERVKFKRRIDEYMRTRKVSNTFNLANQNPKDESW